MGTPSGVVGEGEEVLSDVGRRRAEMAGADDARGRLPTRVMPALSMATFMARRWPRAHGDADVGCGAWSRSLWRRQDFGPTCLMPRWRRRFEARSPVSMTTWMPSAGALRASGGGGLDGVMAKSPASWSMPMTVAVAWSAVDIGMLPGGPGQPGARRPSPDRRVSRKLVGNIEACAWSTIASQEARQPRRREQVVPGRFTGGTMSVTDRSACDAGPTTRVRRPPSVGG